MTIARIRERFGFGDLAWAFGVLVVLALVGRAISHQQWQIAISFALVVLVTGLALVARQAAMMVTVAIWLLAPFLRRLLDLWSTGAAGPDLLSVAPLVCTLVLGAVIAWRSGFPRTPTRLLVIFSLGLALGIPLGISSPTSLLYAALAYLSAGAAIMIGYADAREDVGGLERALLWILPFVALYGIVQFVLPVLPVWDETWLRTSNFVSVGSKDTGDFRAFSTLNSPGTFATVLAYVIAMLFLSRRLDAWRIIVAGLSGIAIAVTFVRSAWVALAGGLVLTVILLRGRGIARVGLLVVVLGVGYVGLGKSGGGGSQATQVVSQRAGTLVSGEADKSASDRYSTFVTQMPAALRAPIGHGLGSVGQASKLSGGGQNYEVIDNGLLISIWQVGLFGALLVLAPFIYVIVRVARAPGRAAMRAAPYVAPVLVFLIAYLAGDTLYGVSGVIACYCVGFASGSLDADGDRARQRSRDVAAA